MDEELALSGRYKSFDFGKRYSLEKTQDEDAAFILSEFSDALEYPAYELSGIGLGKVNDYVDKLKITGKGMPSLISALENISAGQLKDSLLEACGDDKKKMSIAESAFIYLLLKRTGVPNRLSADMFAPSKTLKYERFDSDKQVMFVGNYKNWRVIKKLSLENAQDYEVSAVLCSVNFTSVNKAFDFAGINEEEQVKRISKGRKSLTNLVNALKQIHHSEDPKKLAYLVCKVCEEAGYRPYASPHMLSDAYPDIKPPKVRGRKPKG
ncbi:DUF2666 family protein [Candidatus Micrarchaeota archaeon]|nr:DUF2666 family protein [Candidatus Micrarchaeota archaeon]